MKRFSPKTLKKVSAGICILAGLLASNSKAGNAFFDVNGTAAGTGITAGGTYSWEDPNWAATSGGTAATSTFVESSFAEFAAASDANVSYTVTSSANHTVAGMFLTTAGSETVTLNGTGTLNVASGLQGFLVASGTTLMINNVLGGAGGLAPESSGSLYLNANNTYTGGTTFGFSGSPLTFFNNNNAFGTGAITFSQAATKAEPLLAYGGAALNIANPISDTIAGNIINFAASANTPLTLSGGIALTGAITQIKQNGDATSPLTISGAITGTGGAVFSGNNGGKTTVTAVNSGLTGPVAVGASGAINVTLSLGVANAISGASTINMSGGTLDLGGFHHAMSGTLTLSASSTMDFEGGGLASYAKSAGTTWTGSTVLNLVNWNNITGDLQVGTGNDGLTAAQLADIEFNGTDKGDAAISGQGFIYDSNMAVPEPTTLSILGVFGGLGLLWKRFSKRA